MSQTNTPVISSVEGSVVRITLNRPEKKNALNDELLNALKQALIQSTEDRGTRCVVITGAGSDFCSGADLSVLEKISKASAAENAADARSLMELFLLIRRLPLPVVAAVRGRALAGGCGLASACDIVLAGKSARFGYPEVKIGFVPAMVTAILRRIVSEKVAFELLTRGETINADTAHEIGLVNHVFADETFETEVQSFAESFAGASQSAVALTKSLLYQIDGMPFPEAIETGADVNVIARMTDDCQKGIAQFLSKTNRR